jgi:nickel/cobalt transporter (NiCoT) family protein
VANVDFGLLGVLIIGIFVLSWGISSIIYKVRRYDDIVVKITPKAEELVGSGGQ